MKSLCSLLSFKFHRLLTSFLLWERCIVNGRNALLSGVGVGWKDRIRGTTDGFHNCDKKSVQSSVSWHRTMAPRHQLLVNGWEPLWYSLHRLSSHSLFVSDNNYPDPSRQKRRFCEQRNFRMDFTEARRTFFILSDRLIKSLLSRENNFLTKYRYFFGISLQKITNPYHDPSENNGFQN
jgi:hypothetical protein